MAEPAGHDEAERLIGILAPELQKVHDEAPPETRWNYVAALALERAFQLLIEPGANPMPPDETPFLPDATAAVVPSRDAMLPASWPARASLRYEREGNLLRVRTRSLNNHETREVLVGIWLRLDEDDRADFIRELQYYHANPAEIGHIARVLASDMARD